MTRTNLQLSPQICWQSDRFLAGQIFFEVLLQSFSYGQCEVSILALHLVSTAVHHVPVWVSNLWDFLEPASAAHCSTNLATGQKLSRLSTSVWMCYIGDTIFCWLLPICLIKGKSISIAIYYVCLAVLQRKIPGMCKPPYLIVLDESHNQWSNFCQCKVGTNTWAGTSSESKEPWVWCRSLKCAPLWHGCIFLSFVTCILDTWVLFSIQKTLWFRFEKPVWVEISGIISPVDRI